MWQAAIAHLDASGQPQYFSGIARDITMVKESQKELRDSEEWFRALIANGSDVTLVLTAEGIVTYASPALERLWATRRFAHWDACVRTDPSG